MGETEGGDEGKSGGTQGRRPGGCGQGARAKGDEGRGLERKKKGMKRRMNGGDVSDKRYIPVEIRLEKYQVAEGRHNEAEAGAGQGPNEGDEQTKARNPSRHQGYQQHQGNAHCSYNCPLTL